MLSRCLLLLAALPVLLLHAADPKSGRLPGLRIELEQRHGNAESARHGLGHVSGGTIVVDQSRGDTVQVQLAGLTTSAGLPLEKSQAILSVHVNQRFRVAADRAGLARLSLEAILIGQLSGNRDGAGTAAVDVADCAIVAGDSCVLKAHFLPRSHTGQNLLFVNDRLEPQEVTVPTNSLFELTMHFLLRCEHPKRCFHKNVVTAAFGPEASRVPDWINLLAPFRDLPRQSNLGLQAIVRVAAASEATAETPEAKKDSPQTKKKS